MILFLAIESLSGAATLNQQIKERVYQLAFGSASISVRAFSSFYNDLTRH